MRQTACRIWHYAATGTHCSKQEAVSWAHTQDPSLERADLGRVLEVALQKTSDFRTPPRLPQKHQPSTRGSSRPERGVRP
ncbi:aminoglycoside adenylyltransferase domain-containing protein [Paractinoplanes brasiliensis]|uniref:Uncharacterized protein DUF4111 n=1 Tax=Paractinoplanes brasiliensis TaxID=52695 RepID=A0A4R6JCF8_9ACTN|nr:aminoglycoside adenylyltransferase domain-containing protein [Actinoplanes brasiliensis]TDO32215.1 uncharacterized protein DUF4111 [Actinoplanes brasiliensis]GID28268.1 hypothetical protein Abr02nite_32510 [Actinoplanes brasiliensis]